VMFFTFLFIFFENNAFGRRPLWRVVELFPQDIASAFLCRFRCGLQSFLAEEKRFPRYATIGARMTEKMEKNLRKWVQSLCAPLRPFISKLKENFYHSILPHVLLMCTHIKIFACSLQGATKKLLTCRGSAKSTR